MVRLLWIHSLQFKSPDNAQSKRLQLNALLLPARTFATKTLKGIVRKHEIFTTAKAGQKACIHM